MKDLQTEADQRNWALLGHQADRDIGKHTFWFVRDDQLILLPMNVATEDERAHMTALFRHGVGFSLSPWEQDERQSKLVGAYTAFVAALLVATFANSKDYSHAWVVISLLAVSLPSLIAYMLIDFVVQVKQMRNRSAFRGAAAGLGFLPSLLGITTLIGHFSVIAGVLFVLLTLFWMFALHAVVFLGPYPGSDI
jgi:hypothetical protein